MTKEQLVKINPKNLEYCSIELRSLLNKKLKDRDLKLEVFIYSDTNSPLNVEIEENSCGGATVCAGYIWHDATMYWERKSSLLPLCEICMLEHNQLLKIKRWTTKYMEELATYYVEDLKGN